LCTGATGKIYRTADDNGAIRLQIEGSRLQTGTGYIYRYARGNVDARVVVEARRKVGRVDQWREGALAGRASAADTSLRRRADRGARAAIVWIRRKVCTSGPGTAGLSG